MSTNAVSQPNQIPVNRPEFFWLDRVSEMLADLCCCKEKDIASVAYTVASGVFFKSYLTRLEEAIKQPRPPAMPSFDARRDGCCAAPESHKVVFENYYVRVLEVIIAPGTQEPMHIHPYPRIEIVMVPTKVEYYTPEGLQRTIPQSDERKITLLPPEHEHSIKNLSQYDAYHAFYIELKR